jgi:hypothetical protein
VFSSIFPLNNKNSIQNNYIWNKAIEFGAICYNEINEENSSKITHVVTKKLGTEKVNNALKIPGKFY